MTYWNTMWRELPLKKCHVMIKTGKKKTIGQLHTWTFKFILQETSNLSVSCQAGLYTKIIKVFLQLFLVKYCFSKRICSRKIVTKNVQVKCYRTARFGKQLVNVTEIDLSCVFILVREPRAQPTEKSSTSPCGE